MSPQGVKNVEIKERILNRKLTKMAQEEFTTRGGGYHTADYYEQYSSTIANGDARISICFCVDTSSSMKFIVNKDDFEIIEGSSHTEDGLRVSHARPKRPGVVEITRLMELKKVFSKMLEKMRSNEIIARSAVVSIITFDMFADCYIEFTDINRISPNCPNNIKIGADCTNVSKGLQMALERLDIQTRMNSDAGNDSYKPVLIFMSDGTPTDGQEAEKARIAVRKRSEEGTLNVIPIGIGNNIDRQWMRGLTRESVVFNMERDEEFEKVFATITRKIQHSTMVISTDEGDNNIANNVQEGENSTNYGYDNTSDLESFMNDFQNALPD